MKGRKNLKKKKECYIENGVEREVERVSLIQLGI